MFQLVCCQYWWSNDGVRFLVVLLLGWLYGFFAEEAVSCARISVLLSLLVCFSVVAVCLFWLHAAFFMMSWLRFLFLLKAKVGLAGKTFCVFLLWVIMGQCLSMVSVSFFLCGSCFVVNTSGWPLFVVFRSFSASVLEVFSVSLIVESISWCL